MNFRREKRKIRIVKQPLVFIINKYIEQSAKYQRDQNQLKKQPQIFLENFYSHSIACNCFERQFHGGSARQEFAGKQKSFNRIQIDKNIRKINYQAPAYPGHEDVDK